MAPYYAVREGRQQGIYHTWDECQKNITGYSGARYAKFDTQEQAMDFINSNSSKKAIVEERKLSHPSQNNSHSNNSHSSSRNDYDNNSYYSFNQNSHKDAHKSRYSPKKVVVYTDGACIQNGRRGARAGYGIHYSNPPPGMQAEVSNGVCGPLSGPIQTNQRAELEAIRQALYITPSDSHLQIRTDSRYAIGCSGPWGERWEREGIRDRKNLDLIDDIRHQVKERLGSVEFVHVRAHNGEEGNEKADRLARQGAHSQNPHC